ncbi:polysaccharide pyruvyl transferase family protein [Rhodococcus ruber]|uniref:polysaccharide pyruvyl transferase family protein n=1 Tax=Rhodococcus ruber TaxID=1830 RepID=UPI0026591CFD|nr:polysaccharide pyruvyl transferase family protein [Rhodococcus ruber]WKK12365.1 polysaccharide pyruvyl transferase family protein [Rhodococcus ruber]
MVKIPLGLSARGEPPIRVLIDNGEYWLNNKGDLALLDVTVRRIRARWPDARIGVLTYAPGLLRAFEPTAEPVGYRRGAHWSRLGRSSRLPARLGPAVVGRVSEVWWFLTNPPRQQMRKLPDSVRHPWARMKKWRSHDRDRNTVNPAARIPEAAKTASLIVAMGGGYLADVDTYQATRTLDLLEYACENGIPTAALGQGIGPIDDPVLFARAAKVLPRVDVIALREDVWGPDLLARMGVPDERICTTGDDAVELGYDAGRPEMGSDLGVCLRIADYSPVGDRARTSVRRSVQEFALGVGATLVPLIVSEHESEDRRSTLPLLEGYPSVAVPLDRYARARDLAAAVGRCRVLVTGAYHVAVFALSQGIPVVGLSSSKYYDGKLGGLRAMFGGGLELIHLDDHDLDALLSKSIRELWEAAPQLRPVLRERARAQIATSREVYERVFGLVERTSGASLRPVLDRQSSV